MSQGRIRHFVAKEAISVRDCLRTHFSKTEEEIALLFKLGALYVAKRRVFQDRALKPGDYLRAHLWPKRFPVERVDWPSRVVADERKFIVVNKPAGIPAHATLDNAIENTLSELRRMTGYALLITQRLDVTTEGLMVVAKTPAFQAHFNRLLLERKVQKRYRALTHQPVPIGHHVHFMEPGERAPRRVSRDEKPGWLRCELEVLSCQPKQTWWESEISLLTGRTHQIRAQLSDLGCPILGDKMYGSPPTRTRHDCSLVACYVAWREGERKHEYLLSVEHPFSKPDRLRPSSLNPNG